MPSKSRRKKQAQVRAAQKERSGSGVAQQEEAPDADGVKLRSEFSAALLGFGFFLGALALAAVELLVFYGLEAGDTFSQRLLISFFLTMALSSFVFVRLMFSGHFGQSVTLAALGGLLLAIGLLTAFYAIGQGDTDRIYAYISGVTAGLGATMLFMLWTGEYMQLERGLRLRCHLLSFAVAAVLAFCVLLPFEHVFVLVAAICAAVISATLLVLSVRADH